MSKAPAFMFYPGDWLRDTNLQSCSIAARGLWIQMLCIMHDGNPRGYLKAGSFAIDLPSLARMAGLTIEETETLIEELEHKGVFSRDNDVIFSRRMVKEFQLSELRSKAGQSGAYVRWQKENLAKHLPSPLPEQLPAQCANANANTLIGGCGGDENEDFAQNLKTTEFISVWRKWLAYRNEKRKAVTETEAEGTLAMLAGFGPERAIKAIEHTIAKGWTGIQEPNGVARQPAAGAVKTDAEIADSIRGMAPPLNWGPWKLQQRFAEVGFDGMTLEEQSRMIQAYRKGR